MRIEPSDTDPSSETTSLITDLRDRIQHAESAAQEVKRQNEALQSRLNDATNEQLKLEEKAHEDEERLEELENEKRDLLKQKRELETIYEAERAAVMKDKESTTAREEELQSIIQRLKDSLSHRESSRATDSDLSRNGEQSYIFLQLMTLSNAY